MKFVCKFKKSYSGYLPYLLFLLFYASAGQAQPGKVDPTFNPDDIGFGSGVGASNTVRTVALQPDGKILLGGAFTTYHGNARARLARLHPDGSLDHSFSVGSGANGDVRVAVVQADGKILIGGNFTTYNGITRNRIARLNPDGTLDTGFDPGAGANGLVHTITLLGDDKILLGGAFTLYNDSDNKYLVRLHSNGALDTTFNPGTGPSGTVHAAALLPDGKLLIGGAFTSFDGTGSNRVARLQADGSRDAGFTPGTGANGIVYSMRLLRDGRFLIGGAFTTYNGTARARVALLQADGSLDTSFFPGTGASSTVHSIVLQPDDRIIIGGEFTSYNGTTRNRLARLTTDGRLDTSFESGAGGIVYSIALEQDNRLLIGGAFTSYNEQVKNRIARLEPDGNLDENFEPGAGANGIVYAAAIAADGNLYIGGAFTSYNGTPINRIARLLPNGSLDNSFQPGTGAGGEVRAITVQPDGKILIGGSFTSYRGVSRNYIARLNTDGSLDNSFEPVAGANGIVHTIRLQSDGKILLGGAFTSYNNIARARVARLHTDGSLDNSFEPGTGAAGIVYTMALLPAGKLLIGGAFTTYNGTARSRIALLQHDGSLDLGFTPGTGASADVRALAVQNDGQILIGGSFVTYNGIARNRLARLHADGTLDTGFESGTGASATIYALLVQPDDKIVLGGDFTTYNGTTSVRFARLHRDGALDAVFDTGTGANGAVHTSVMQPDGRLLLGGAFTSYNTTGRNRLVRILNDNNLLRAPGQQEEKVQVLVYPNPSQGEVVLLLPPGPEEQAPESLLLYDALGRQVYEKKLAGYAGNGIKLAFGALAKGLYYLKINFKDRSSTTKLVLY